MITFFFVCQPVITLICFLIREIELKFYSTSKTKTNCKNIAVVVDQTARELYFEKQPLRMVVPGFCFDSDFIS